MSERGTTRRRRKHVPDEAKEVDEGSTNAAIEVVVGCKVEGVNNTGSPNNFKGEGNRNMLGMTEIGVQEECD